MQAVSSLAPPDHLPKTYHKFFDNETTEVVTKDRIKLLREQLLNDPNALVEIIVAGARDNSWILRTGKVLKRLFKDANNLLLVGKISQAQASRIAAVFSSTSVKLIQNSIHRDITIVHKGEEFKASKTILIGYSEYFRAFFCGNFLEGINHPLTEFEKNKIVKHLSFNAFKALYEYMETKNKNLFDSFEPRDLWDMVRVCDLWRCNDLKDQIESQLIKKTNVVQAFESLLGCKMFSLKRLEEHCLAATKTSEFTFHKRDGVLSATITNVFKAKDIEEVAKNSEYLQGLSFQDKRFSAADVGTLVERLPNLDSITLAISTEGISTSARQVIGSSIKIRTLKINPLFGKDSTGPENSGVVETAGLDHIQCLDLRKLPLPYRRFAMGLILNLGNQLLDIRLGTCHWLDDKFIEGMTNPSGEAVWPLQFLDLGDCHNITDKVIAILATRFPQLVVLNISGTQITGEGVKTILTGCPRISDLNLGRLNIYELLVNNPQLFNNLKRLKLSGKSFTEKDFAILFQNCSQMQDLNVDRCKNFRLMMLAGSKMPLLSILTFNADAFSYENELPLGFFDSFKNLKKLVILGKIDDEKRSLILAYAKIKQDLEIEFIQDNF